MSKTATFRGVESWLAPKRSRLFLIPHWLAGSRARHSIRRSTRLMKWLTGNGCSRMAFRQIQMRPRHKTTTCAGFTKDCNSKIRTPNWLSTPTTTECITRIFGKLRFTRRSQINRSGLPQTLRHGMSGISLLAKAAASSPMREQKKTLSRNYCWGIVKCSSPPI